VRPTRLGNEQSHLRRNLRDRRSFLKPETRFLARSRDETFLRTQARSTHGTECTLVARLHSSPPFLKCNLDRQEATDVPRACKHTQICFVTKWNKTNKKPLQSTRSTVATPAEEQWPYLQNSWCAHTPKHLAALLTSKHPLNLVLLTS
jgi:hypothetical protein